MTDSTPLVLAASDGALLEAPVYQTHKRGRNWLAKIATNPASPGGLERNFQNRAHGEWLYMLNGLKVNDAIEFGADYYSTSGRKHADRWYGVVLEIRDDALVVEECRTGFMACQRAKELRNQAPVASRQELPAGLSEAEKVLTIFERAEQQRSRTATETLHNEDAAQRSEEK